MPTYWPRSVRISIALSRNDGDRSTRRSSTRGGHRRHVRGAASAFVLGIAVATSVLGVIAALAGRALVGAGLPILPVGAFFSVAAGELAQRGWRTTIDRITGGCLLALGMYLIWAA